jgi:hypothetical protein
MASGYFTLDQVNYDEIWYNVALPAMDLYRSAKIPIIDTLSTPHDLTLFPYILGKRMGFQPLGRTQKPDMRQVEEAWMVPTYEKWGVGVGTDRDTLALSPSRRIIASINRVFVEDPEEITRRMLRKMLVNPGTLNAGYGFYNGTFSAEEKLTAPPPFGENVFLPTHNHYTTTQALVTAAGANLTLPVISAAKTHLQHHGNNGMLSGFMNRQTAESFENMLAVTNALTRSPVSDEIAMRGFTDAFMLLGVVWYVTEVMPAGYILLVQTSGDVDGKPLLFFEPPNLRGLRMFPGGDSLHPLIESYFERYAGWKVWDRGAGLAIQMVASATYTNPTFVAP